MIRSQQELTADQQSQVTAAQETLSNLLGPSDTLTQLNDHIQSITSPVAAEDPTAVATPVATQEETINGITQTRGTHLYKFEDGTMMDLGTDVNAIFSETNVMIK